MASFSHLIINAPLIKPQTLIFVAALATSYFEVSCSPPPPIQSLYLACTATLSLFESIVVMLSWVLLLKSVQQGKNQYLRLQGWAIFNPVEARPTCNERGIGTSDRLTQDLINPT